jgi:Pectate lyase superfamily protein
MASCSASGPDPRQPRGDSGGASGSEGQAQGGETVTATMGGEQQGGVGGGAGTATAGEGSAPPELIAVLAGDAPYEAELSFHGGSGSLEQAPDASGTAYLRALGENGARVVFAVNAAADGPSELSLRYRLTGSAKEVGVRVNASPVAPLQLTPGDAFVDATLQLELRRGLNTVALESADGATAVDLDYLLLPSGAPRPERGALSPSLEYEAERAVTNATVIGPFTQVGLLATGASGRRAVTLATEGDYVEWTLTEAANGIILRYSLPDPQAGGGAEGAVSLYVDGEKRESLALSSKNAWLYDPFPFSNTPGPVSSRPFSERRYLVGAMPKGATLRLQRDPDDGAQPVTVDLLEAEQVPEPYEEPAGSFSVDDYGAVADDGNDDAAALASAVAAARAMGGVVWLPAGAYDLATRVNVDRVTLRGAGPWHTELRGQSSKGGLNGSGDAVQLLDLSIVGDTTEPDAAAHSGVDGKLGRGSLIQNLWIMSTRAGVALTDTTGLYVVGSRIADTYAGGVALNGAVSHTTIEHVRVRSSGDDGLAVFSSRATGHNRFVHCTVQAPYYGSGIAIYGGDSNGVDRSQVSDTVRNGAGIQVSTRRGSDPLAGVTSISSTTVTRAGSIDVPNANCFGSLWLFANAAPLDAPLFVRDLVLSDGSCHAVHIGGREAVKQVSLEQVEVKRTAGAGIKIETTGSASFVGVTLVSTARPAEIAAGFDLTRGAGNAGW